MSRATARDAIRIIGLRPERVIVTGGGVSPEFKPPVSRRAALEELRRRRRAIGGKYVLFAGGMDYRKNVDGLLKAYADCRRSYATRMPSSSSAASGSKTHAPFAERAASLGISDRVVFTGHVDDGELVLLYQATSLFVFPSRYEGFGLPVIEALACGAPAIVGRNSSLVELVDAEEALFDTAEPISIRRALVRALGDERMRERLRRPEIRDRFTWQRIAELTVAAYEKIAPRRLVSP